VHVKFRISVTALIVLLSVVVDCAHAFPAPRTGTENIPAMMAGSALVCKGEVEEAPVPSHVPSAVGVARMTATASVRPDRCFKGDNWAASILVAFDSFVTGVDPFFILHKGDYRLFFLKPHGTNRYEVVDVWFGALPVSRELGPVIRDTDPMYRLELDLRAGLRDPNPELVLDSIRMLGNMKHLRSTTELKSLLDQPDLLRKTYVWQALLRLKDYSVLPAVAEFFDSQPQPPTVLLLPRDRLFAMQDELGTEIGTIRDPSTLRYLERFAVTGKWQFLRMHGLDALRAIGSLHSAAAFLKELDDANHDNAFSAMQGLLSLAGGGPIDWVPTWKQFGEDPQFYAAKCREWWQAEGHRKAASRAVISFPQRF
jgi:hypothetical protein